jgi:hypothetical protein
LVPHFATERFRFLTWRPRPALLPKKFKEPLRGDPNHTFRDAATACRKYFYPRDACHGTIWRQDIAAKWHVVADSIWASNVSVDEKICRTPVSFISVDPV